MKNLFTHFYGNLNNYHTPTKCLQFIDILNEYLKPNWHKITNYPDRFLPLKVLKRLYLANEQKIYAYKYCCKYKVLCAFQLWVYTYTTLKQAKTYLFTHTPTEMKTDFQNLNEIIKNPDLPTRLEKFLYFKQNRPIQTVYFEYLKQDFLMDLVLYRLFHKKLKTNELYSEEFLLIKKATYMFNSFLTNLAKQVKILIVNQK